MDGMPSTPVADRVSNSAAVQPPAGRRRKVFYLVDSLNVGGTETQAVELALRLPVSGEA